MSDNDGSRIDAVDFVRRYTVAYSYGLGGRVGTSVGLYVPWRTTIEVGPKVIKLTPHSVM